MSALETILTPLFSISSENLKVNLGLNYLGRYHNILRKEKRKQNLENFRALNASNLTTGTALLLIIGNNSSPLSEKCSLGENYAIYLIFFHWLNVLRIVSDYSCCWETSANQFHNKYNISRAPNPGFENSGILKIDFWA